ncbi:MAG: HD domain-containing protein [Candidatus Helarchaeales archaeon]
MIEDSKLIAILSMLARFKLKERRIWNEYSIPFSESIAEHSMHVAFACWLLGQNEKLDMNKLLTMAIIHELPACILPEFPMYFDKSVKEIFLNELSKIEKHLNEIFDDSKDLLDLLREYYLQASPEAKFLLKMKSQETLIQATELKNTMDSPQLQELIKKLENLIKMNDY